MARHATPNLSAVLAAFAPGRVVRLSLSEKQKRALRDRDGQLALSVVRHLLGARRASVEPQHTPESFPLTEQAFQAVAGRLGHAVGIKRCRRLLRRLDTTGVLEDAGSYRQRYKNQGGSGGFRVRLYRLVAPIRTAPLGRKRLSAFPRASSPQLTVRWWQHPLFGDYEGRPPPQWTRRRRQQTASQDEYGAGVCLRPDFGARGRRTR
jgi:hypothetical protein